MSDRNRIFILMMAMPCRLVGWAPSKIAQAVTIARRIRIKFSLAATVICLLGINAANSKPLHTTTLQCEIDQDHSLAEMEKWKEPWSKKIPNDFKIIDNKPFGFRVDDARAALIFAYNLPDDENAAASRAGAGVGIGFRGLASCVIQSEKNKSLWLVEIPGADTDGYLDFFKNENIVRSKSRQ